MKIKKYFIFLIIFLLSSCISQDKGFKIKEHAFYLTDTQVKSFSLANPPQPNSIEEKKDMFEIMKIQNKRTEEDCKEAVAEKHANFEDFFGKNNPFPDPLPQEVKDFFKIIKEDADIVVNYYKNIYKRQRPFLKNKDIKTCFGLKAGGYSYPSGHSTIANLYSLILIDLDPENKEFYEQKADKAALNRVIWGVHYPSDIEEGKKLAKKIYQELIKNPDFKKQMENIRKYIVENANLGH